MLRNVDDWDGQHFAFPTGGPQHAGATVASVHAGPAGPVVTISDAHFLFNADFRRDGSDLILTGDHGKTTIVPDYFATGQRATLFSGNGMSLSPEVVEALAGPMAPGQYAQAGGAQQGAQAVGRVAKVDGDVTVVRNGVAITVNVGDAILKGDVLQTRSGQLGVTFNDGSTINLTENARLVVNEFVYDPKGHANSQILDLVQGSLSFISGEVAHSGDMKIGTPVATMGIRGTVGLITGAETDHVSFSIVQSERGAVLIDNNTGREIAQVVQNGPMLVLRPTGPLQVVAEEVQKTPAELAAEIAALQHILGVQTIGQQIIDHFFNQDQNNPQSNGTDHTQIQIDIPKSTILTENSGDSGNGGNTGGNNAIVTVTTTSDNTGNNNTPEETQQQFTVEIPDNLAPVIFTPFASAFVSEEGLANGIADSVGNTDSTDSVVAQGTIDAGDANGDTLTFTFGAPTTALTSNGVPVTWTGVGTSTLVGKAGSDTIITVAIDPHTGNYTVTLAGPVDHVNTTEEDIKTIDVPVNVSDGQNVKTASLAVTVEDDHPFAAAYQANVSTGTVATSTVNIVVILDISGSMGTIDSGSETRLELAQAALHNLLGTTNVTVNQVMAVAFGTSPSVNLDGQGSAWTDAATAAAFIAGLSANGGSTYYDAALAAVDANWDSGPSNADETLVYFISDGAPTSGHGADTGTWETFLSSHGIDVSYAIGISTNATDSDLTPIAWTPDDPNFSPISLTDATALDDTLQGTVPVAQTHNIFTDNASVGFGADGGHIMSVEFAGTIYSWNGLDTITKSGLGTGTLAASMIALDTVLGGHFEFHFADGNGHQAGDWSYLQPDQIAQLTDAGFHYVLLDNDGDTSGADVTFNYAPAIDAHGLVAIDVQNSNDTTVTGLVISDPNSDANNDPLTVDVTVDHGTLTFDNLVQNVTLGDNGTSAPTVDGTLNSINDLLNAGFTYSPNVADGNDKITMTVTDAQGASDTLNFVFNVDNPQNTPIALVGTTGKDFIFATGYDDTLTGNGNSDTFVFFAQDAGGSHHITDFSPLNDFLQFDQALFQNQTVADLLSGGSVEQVNGSAVFTTDGGAATITVDNVSLTDLVQHQDHVLIV